MQMEYKDIERVNETIKTLGIERKDKNGKITVNEYAQVNERIKAFRMLYPDGSITTDLLSNENGVCVFKATVMALGCVLGTGHAQEKENSSFINKTSYIENCETSAVGRALGMLGLGIDSSIASAEEVENAILNQEPTQEDAEKWKFGEKYKKHAEELLSDVIKSDAKYVQWYLNNAASEYDKKCYELLTGEKLPTNEELDERIKLIHELNELENNMDIDHDEVLNRLGIKSLNELTDIQLVECINNLKKVQK